VFERSEKSSSNSLFVALQQRILDINVSRRRTLEAAGLLLVANNEASNDDNEGNGSTDTTQSDNQSGIVGSITGGCNP